MHMVNVKTSHPMMLEMSDKTGHWFCMCDVWWQKNEFLAFNCFYILILSSLYDNAVQ